MKTTTGNGCVHDEDDLIGFFCRASSCFFIEVTCQLPLNFLSVIQIIGLKKPRWGGGLTFTVNLSSFIRLRGGFQALATLGTAEADSVPALHIGHKCDREIPASGSLHNTHSLSAGGYVFVHTGYAQPLRHKGMWQTNQSLQELIL